MRAKPALALSLSLALTSCSWIVVQPPHPAAHVGDPPGPCTRSDAPAHVDAALTFAGVLTLFAGVTYLFKSDPAGPAQVAIGVGVVALPALLAFGAGASAQWGYRNASRCRRLERAYKAP